MFPLSLNLPNSSISQEELETIRNSINSNATNIANLKNSYDTGVSAIASKITACGVSTANNASPSTMVNNIGSIYTNRYNQGINDGRQGYYSQAQYDNWGSTRYNQGVTDADNRANGNSVNYQTGYNNGVNAGKNACRIEYRFEQTKGKPNIQNLIRSIASDPNKKICCILLCINMYYAPILITEGNQFQIGYNPLKFSEGYSLVSLDGLISKINGYSVDNNYNSIVYYTLLIK